MVMEIYKSIARKPRPCGGLNEALFLEVWRGLALALAGGAPLDFHDVDGCEVKRNHGLEVWYLYGLFLLNMMFFV